MNNSEINAVAVVSIQVSRGFGQTLSSGTFEYFDKGYGIGSTYFDIKVEVGTDLWRECLYHQVNLTIEGLTKAEFMLPMYNWLHRLIPTNLGSNRHGGHSAFDWCNKFSIEKVGKVITLNGGQQAFSLSGKKLKSPLEKELEAAMPKAPKGLPYVFGSHEEYGTTVCLGGNSTKLIPLLNASTTGGLDLEKIRSKYSGEDSIDWSEESYSVGFPYVVGVTSCILVDTCEGYSNLNEGETTRTFMWLFPNKAKYVPLGDKKSFQLLKELGGAIPAWLVEKFSKFPVKGDGWAVIN